MPASSVIRKMRHYARLRGKPTRSTWRLLPQGRHRGQGYASNEISNSIKVPTTARSGGADPAKDQIGQRQHAAAAAIVDHTADGRAQQSRQQ